MSKTVARCLTAICQGLTLPMARLKRFETLAQAHQLMDIQRSVPAHGEEIRFYTSSKWVAKYTGNESSLEDDTLSWIDGMNSDDVLWDIGANIGIYSIYAAKKGLEVLAFEPAHSNYYALCRNAQLNRCDDRIRTLPLAFSDHSGLEQIFLTSSDAGSALHAVGVKENIYGSFAPTAQHSVVSLTMDNFVAWFGISPPTHIKLDVDSIELLILQGGPETLAKVKSVLVEIEEIAKSDNEIHMLLTDAGFTLSAHSDADSRNAIYER